jgi:hypothetical protein
MYSSDSYVLLIAFIAHDLAGRMLPLTCDEPRGVAERQAIFQI